ncbi:hypothetical protein HII31_13086 [Pseudocercospora fuligena]|uniref:Uncharacterized protein n=1 Tax=Pseudocercospora fuligena TaxID=685502 RepID=A0A8H6R5N3_9PEZI|nr:hypothetical protein HII31_13086 [Pseudocercospora fuligena]
MSTTIVAGSWCWILDYDAEHDRFANRYVFVCGLRRDPAFKEPYMIVCYGQPSVDQDQRLEKLSAATSWTLRKDFRYISSDCVVEGFTDMPDNGRLVVLNSLKETVTLRSDLCRGEGGVDQGCKVYCDFEESAKSSGKKRAAPSSSKASNNGQQDEDENDEEFIPKRVRSEAADVAIKQAYNAEAPSSHAYKAGEQVHRGTRRQPDRSKQNAGKDQGQMEGGEKSQQPIAASAGVPEKLSPWDELQRHLGSPQSSHLVICQVLETWSASVAKELRELESKKKKDLKSRQDFTNGVWQYVMYLRNKKVGGPSKFPAGHPFVEQMEQLGRELRAKGFKLERPNE